MRDQGHDIILTMDANSKQPQQTTLTWPLLWINQFQYHSTMEP